MLFKVIFLIKKQSTRKESQTQKIVLNSVLINESVTIQLSQSIFLSVSNVLLLFSSPYFLFLLQRKMY